MEESATAYRSGNSGATGTSLVQSCGEDRSRSSASAKSGWRSLRSSTSPTVVESIYFRDNTLLRGIGAERILHRHGQVLANSAGSVETYAMSKRVNHINAFISHNWSTPRWPKYWALVLCFNMRGAILTSLVASLAALAMTASGSLPMFDMHSDVGDHYQIGGYCLLTGNITFWIALIYWQEIRACSGKAGPILFLDKTCIDQVDVQRQREGITGIAAFLRVSRGMVVVYTDAYLQRLWTVYELASYVALNLDSQNTLRVIPTVLPTVVFFGIVMYLFFWICYAAVHLQQVHQALGSWAQRASFIISAIISMPATVCFCAIFRRWARDVARMSTHVANFCIGDAKCFNEQDRTLVQRNIAAFMSATGRAPPEVEEEEGLQVFGELIRQVVPDALANSLGRAKIPYKYVVIMFLSQTFLFLDIIGSDLLSGLGPMSFVEDFFAQATIQFAVLPLAVWLVSWLTRSSLWLTGFFKEWVCTISISLVACMFAVGLVILITILKSNTTESSLAQGAFYASNAVFFILVVILYRPFDAKSLRCLPQVGHLPSSSSAGDAAVQPEHIGHAQDAEKPTEPLSGAAAAADEESHYTESDQALDIEPPLNEMAEAIQVHPSIDPETRLSL